MESSPIKRAEENPSSDHGLAEKPLEMETISEADSAKVGYKPGKKSRFKSIFTKSVSLRKLQASETSLVGKGVSGKCDDDGTGTSNKGFKTLPTSKSSTSVFKEETVQIHKDPFLVGPSPTNKNSSNPPPSAPVPASPNISVTLISEEERIPTRPQPHFQKRSIKSVNTREVESTSALRNVRKTQKRSTSGARNKQSSTDKNQFIDPRLLKRRNAKIKERAKTKELLLLVEELAHNCEYYKNSLKRKQDRQEMESYQVRKENEHLNLQIFKLGQQIEEWREKCEKMESKSVALAKVKLLSKENKELLDDLQVLKTVICRLNKELSYYQDKLRNKYKDSPENILTYSTTSSGTEFDETELHQKDTQDGFKGWVQNPRKTLLPLLIAYDEVIAEKEEIIKDHEVALDRFKEKCMEVTNENADLHKLISSNKERGTISIDEWESLRSNAVLVVEENDLLHDQVNNLKRKEEKLFSTFQEKAAGFKQTISHLENEIGKLKTALANLESKCNRLTEENARLNSNLQSKVPRDKHDAMIQEFKHAFEELKSNYDSEKKNLIEKLSSLEKEKDRLNGVVANLGDANTQLKNEVQETQNQLLENAQIIQKMETSILENASTREATNKVIEDFMHHVQQLVGEKKKLEEELQEERLVNDQIMSVRNQETVLVADLHSKIEAMERLHNDEIKKAQHRLKELEEKMKVEEERHRREKTQFVELIKEKDRRVEYVEAEKKQLQQDLETVWKTTTTTIQRRAGQTNHFCDHNPIIYFLLLCC